MFKQVSAVYWILAVSVFFGHFLAFWLVELFDFHLIIDGFADIIWLFFFMPLVESWVFNGLLQQGVYHYLQDKKMLSSTKCHLYSLIVMSIWFSLLHVFNIGFGGIFWILPAVVLGMIWLLSQNVLLVALVHACWNLSLAWFSSQG